MRRSRAREFVAAGDPEGDITGINADDESGEITIELTRPDASFANVLALSVAAPLPASTDPRLRAVAPPGVGPYEIAGADPDRRVRPRAQRGFPDLDIPDIPTGNLASIKIKVGGDAAIARRACSTASSTTCRTRRRADSSRRCASRPSDRFREHPTAPPSTSASTSAGAPFDDPLVREAVNTAIDQPALAHATRIRAARLLVAAPGVPGYDEVLDHAGCPYGDPAAARRGRARDLIRQAGARGEPVTVAAAGEPTHGRDRGLAARSTASASTHASPGRRAATRRPSPAAHSAQTGANLVGVPDPLDFLPAPARSAGQAPLDPLIDPQLERLAAALATRSVGQRLGALDRYLVSPPQSYVAVFGHPRATTLLSERIDPGTAIYNPVFGNDYSSWSCSEGE